MDQTQNNLVQNNLAQNKLTNQKAAGPERDVSSPPSQDTASQEGASQEEASQEGASQEGASQDRKTDLIRHNWQTNEIVALLETPLMSLLYQAQSVHRTYHEDGTVQLASLLSIKTGSCPEDCKYCPQSAHYSKQTGIDKQGLLAVGNVLAKAQTAKQAGATRFCMGAAWRNVRDGAEFDQVIDMVQGVTDMGMEACVTLGMLSKDQAERLAEAGLTSYNHNLDTSPEFYQQIITTPHL